VRIDFAEDDHLRAVGAALGLPAESFKELVVDVVEEIDLGDDLDRLRYRLSASLAGASGPRPGRSRRRRATPA
jgi:hypothetical protein